MLPFHLPLLLPLPNYQQGPLEAPHVGILVIRTVLWVRIGPRGLQGGAPSAGWLAGRAPGRWEQRSSLLLRVPGSPALLHAATGSPGERSMGTAQRAPPPLQFLFVSACPLVYYLLRFKIHLKMSGSRKRKGRRENYSLPVSIL